MEIENSKYGKSFIENLARDIKAEFPNAKGYSARKLRYMRTFAELVTDEANLQIVSANLTWRNNITLMSKVKDEAVR